MIVFPVRLLRASNSSKQNIHKAKCVYNKAKILRYLLNFSQKTFLLLTLKKKKKKKKKTFLAP